MVQTHHLGHFCTELFNNCRISQSQSRMSCPTFSNLSMGDKNSRIFLEFLEIILGKKINDGGGGNLLILKAFLVFYGF